MAVSFLVFQLKVKKKKGEVNDYGQEKRGENLFFPLYISMPNHQNDLSLSLVFFLFRKEGLRKIKNQILKTT
jgi:hypothetical protein